MQYEKVALVLAKHELLAAGLQTLIEETVPHTRVRIFADWNEALEAQAGEPQYSLAFIDADTVATDGLDLTNSLRRNSEKIALIIVATYSQRNDVLKYLGWGAHGVVFKCQPVAEIAAAVKLVMSGGLSVPKFTNGGVPVIGADPPRLTDRRIGRRETVPEVLVEPISTPTNRSRLSQRQATVLELLARGLPNKAIARELGLAEATVKAHVNAVFRALNVNNRASAAVMAVRASGANIAAE